MLTSSEIRNIYEKIQKQLFYMIPEKWDRVYLYASVLDHYNNVQTGEMFFYYYPKSVLKKNPVNVYEVPNKFNIDEGAYLKLAEKLYEEIKKLRICLVKIGEKPWTNLTISIENFKFNVEYNYDDLINSNYTSYDRHLIWRYKYLNVPLNSYQKKDRKMIEEYLQKEEYHNKNISTYTEGIYKKPVSNITQYDSIAENIDNKQATENELTVKSEEYTCKASDMEDLKSAQEKRTDVGRDHVSAQPPIIKSQILNTRIKNKD